MTPPPAETPDKTAPGAPDKTEPDTPDKTAAPALSETSEPFIRAWTDLYFQRTRAIVRKFGDAEVTYAVFMRRPVISAPRLAAQFIAAAGRARGAAFAIEQTCAEGEWAGAGEPLLYITGPLSALADLETLYLQKLGAACVAAHNAFQMCTDMKNTAFLAMDARHCAGTEMAELMAYAAAVGSDAAKARSGAKGFTGAAAPAAAGYFGAAQAAGTMPHALIGYAGSTLRAAEMFAETHPDAPLTVLADYFGLEVTDALTVCRRFPAMASAGELSVRIDTHGGRFVEGLDPQKSYAVLERHAPDAVRRYRGETELRYLIGPGVSAAALFHLREQLDRAGFDAVKITASSGFGVAKCRVMGEVGAPADTVGTGSFLPERWAETYATADIVAYDGEPRVKAGREFLLRK